MAVGKINFPKMPSIDGVRLSAVAAGIRYKDRTDLALIELCEGSVVSGCFTQNSYKAAPVIVSQAHLASSKGIRYLLINSGNANACTGEQGLKDAKGGCQLIADLTGTSAVHTLPFSTGVIGEALNMTAFTNALPGLVSELDDNGWDRVSKAIMTTDSFPKTVSKSIRLDGADIQINGIAKGAGMIRPDMATMLSYVVTNANISEETLQKICLLATQKSFNRVTVDGDTSTNDSVILAATKKASNRLIEQIDSGAGSVFCAAVVDVFQQLAQLLVRDGEGATKFVTLDVLGGKTAKDCLDVAYTIAHSPLVKTALFASDPNWGRLVAAIGRSGVEGIDAGKIKIWIDDCMIVDCGGIASDYTEAKGQAVFGQEEFSIRIDLAMGDNREQIWTCDLSHEYVSINADYRS